jgi:hypothetical protein
MSTSLEATGKALYENLSSLTKPLQQEQVNIISEYLESSLPAHSSELWGDFKSIDLKIGTLVDYSDTGIDVSTRRVCRHMGGWLAIAGNTS